MLAGQITYMEAERVFAVSKQITFLFGFKLVLYTNKDVLLPVAFPLFGVMCLSV